MLRLSYRPPLDWHGLLAFLAARAIPGIESVSDGVYRRSVPGGHVAVHQERGGGLVLSAPPEHLAVAAARTRRLFDLDAEPAAITAALGGDPLLGPLVHAHPGVRVPGCWDAFELAVRAILGQQVSVRGATTTAARLVRELGEPVDTGRAELTHLFPSPDRVADAQLTGMPRSRAAAIRAVAGAAIDGGIPGNATALQQLPGIGPWTAQYVAMRALRDPDAYPSGDLGLRDPASAG